MELHAHPHRGPAASVAVVAAMALALALGILAMPDWTPFGVGSAGARPETSPAAAVCHQCAVVESVRSMDRAEVGAPSGVTLRGFGDDLMSVLVLSAGALTGNRPHHAASADTSHEVTIRFDDGTTHVFRTVGGRRWEPGDRVRIVEGRIQADGPRPGSPVLNPPGLR